MVIVLKLKHSMTEIDVKLEKLYDGEPSRTVLKQEC